MSVISLLTVSGDINIRIAWLGSPNTGFYSFIYLLSALYYFLFIYLHHHFISKIKVGTNWATIEL